MHTPVIAEAEAQGTSPSRPKLLPTLPALLFRLVLACLLPALLGAGIMIYMEHERSRTLLKESTLLSVQDKLHAVDIQLAQAELFTQTLAISENLTRQNFAIFHEKTLRLLNESKLNLSVILYDASGQQLLNTNTLYGAPLGKRQDLGQLQSVFATGRMVRSTVISRTSDGHAMVGILAPVFSGQKVVYALAVGFSPQKLNPILSLQHLSADTITAIIDSTGTIAARSHEAEKFIGQKALPELRKQLEKQSQGSFDFTSRVGNTIHATYSRSPSTSWTFVVGIPHQSLEAPLSRNLGGLLLGSVLLLGLSLVSAELIGKRIAKSVWGLHDAAVALGAGDLTEVPAGATSETHELSQAIQASARLLKRRTQQLQTANDNLQERSTELSEAQHIAKTGNWKWHASSGAFFASEELLRLYGRKILLPFDAQKGKVFPAEAWQELKTAVKATLQTKTGFTLLLPTLTEVGTQLWTRVNGEPVCNASGDVTGLRGTLQDVEDYVQAEIALKDNAKRYRTLFDGSPEAIVVHLNGKVSFANTAAVKLFVADAEADLVGQPLSQFVHPDFLRAVAARLSSITQLGESVPPLELTFITLKGQTFSAQARSSGVIFEGNRHIQTYIHDLSQQKRHDAEIAHLQAEMQDMLVWQVAQHTVAALAHEVNQPLASASILCEAADRMLVAEGLSVAAKKEHGQRLQQTLKNITNEIERAGAVLRNLVHSVVKPDTTRVPEMVNPLITQSIQTAFESADFDYQIVTDYADDLPAVKVNRLQVVKALLNLIRNAAQAMHDAQISAGKISVSSMLLADGSAVCVNVRDEGPGISPDLQQEVFQPFISTKSHGLGMGLTISRALIEANGGKLWHTEKDGPGATFHFTLPLSN